MLEYYKNLDFVLLKSEFIFSFCLSKVLTDFYNSENWSVYYLCKIEFLSFSSVAFISCISKLKRYNWSRVWYLFEFRIVCSSLIADEFFLFLMFRIVIWMWRNNLKIFLFFLQREIILIFGYILSNSCSQHFLDD